MNHFLINARSATAIQNSTFKTQHSDFCILNMAGAGFRGRVKLENAKPDN